MIFVNKNIKYLFIFQFISISITILIFIVSPYFNIWYSLFISEVYTNSIGILYIIFNSILSHIKIEINFLNSILKLLFLILSFLFGTIITEFFISNILFFNFSSEYKYLFYISIIVIIFLILSLILIYINLRNKIIENEKLKSEKINSELIALRSKLNPHFLFNTLNILLEIGQNNYELLEKIVINLSNIYRKILYSSSKEYVFLEDELELIKDYLEIEKIRLGKRLEYNFSISEDIKKIKIPPLILEPIVENSIIHGISKKKDGGKISINGIKENGKIKIIIEDNGIGKDIKLGFGLSSIKNRLELMNLGEIKIENNKPFGIKTIITLRIEDNI